MATTAWVSDEVWARLDPDAGRLGRRGRWALTAVVIAAVAVCALGYAFLAAGLVRPRLTLRGDGWEQASSAARARTVTVIASLYNAGWTQVTVDSLTTSSHGLRVSGAEALPRTIRADTGTTIAVDLQMTDCAHPGPLVLLARVPRWWGTATVRLAVSDLPDVVAAACGRS